MYVHVLQHITFMYMYVQCDYESLRDNNYANTVLMHNRRGLFSSLLGLPVYLHTNNKQTITTNKQPQQTNKLSQQTNKLSRIPITHKQFTQQIYTCTCSVRDTRTIHVILMGQFRCPTSQCYHTSFHTHSFQLSSIKVVRTSG